MLVLLLACTHGATVALDDTGGHDLDTSVDDTSSTAFEGDQAGECADGADNDQDGFFDCEDLDCAGAPDCQAVDTGDSSVDTADTDSGVETGDSGVDTGDTAVEPVCNPVPTQIVGFTVQCGGREGWTVTVQMDGEPYDMDIWLQDWTGGTMSTGPEHDSRQGSLRLSGDCCNVVTDNTFSCADDVEVMVIVIDPAGSAVDYSSAGPAGGHSWPAWAGADADCPPEP